MAHNTEVKPNELNMFQRDCLRHISLIGPCSGTDLMDSMEDEYKTDINHSRTYQCLDELSTLGLLDKGKFDNRTNKYEITSEGREMIEYFRGAWDHATEE